MMANGDMPLLASVLQSTPTPHTPEAQELKQRIHSLPYYLRARGFHKSPSPSTSRVQPGYLCDLHKQLKKGLCYEIMSLVQYEIGCIGRYTYSVIMSGELDAREEMQARQLEPVPMMYVPEFNAYESAPAGHQPIFPGTMDQKGVFVPQWVFEVSQCPACMLSRIGSDTKVLFALLAGLVARISRRRRGHRENLKSRRIRFVKEWLGAREDGNSLVDDAFYLGGRMRDIMREQKKRAREERNQERARAMQAREGHDIRVEISGHRQMHRHDGPGSRAGEDVTGYRESVIGIGISESYAPQYRQASRHPAPDIQRPTDQNPAIGVDISEPFLPGAWSRRDSVSFGKENSQPERGARGTDRDSDEGTLVGVDISEPFIPAPRQPTTPTMAFASSRQTPVHRSPCCEPDADELFIPAPTHPRTTQLPTTPLRDRSRRSGMVFETSAQHTFSIASSFGSNVSLSDLRAPSAHPSLYPNRLRIANERLPPIPERSMNMVSQPHPTSIYGVHGISDTHTAGQYADVSPPVTPDAPGYSGQGTRARYDASPPLSPAFDEFEISPPGTPVLHSRPVTTWGPLYGQST
jgi:hypothetical protein